MRHSSFVIILSLAGIALLLLAAAVIKDYADHIRRTFRRADAARKGETSPDKIWCAGQQFKRDMIPKPCLHLWFIVLAFLGAFAVIIVLAAKCA